MVFSTRCHIVNTVDGMQYRPVTSVPRRVCSAKYVLPELIVSEKKNILNKKSTFLSLTLQKVIQVKFPLGS